MAHAAATYSAQHFQDLPTSLHSMIATYLHAYEAQATSATAKP